MTLDARLQTVLEFIEADVHADIGTDHARLPLALVRSGRCQRVIAVEVSAGPLALARSEVARAGLGDRIEVRHGDGLAPIGPGEVDSASLTGMGARTILGILSRARWLPPSLVVQPNAEAGALRSWARRNGYHLQNEALVPGFWRYPVLHLVSAPGPDPAYTDLPEAAALSFGPHLLRAADAQLAAELRQQERRLAALAQHGRPEVSAELQTVLTALRTLGATG
ncbi:tRNA (adenine-N(1))-methyltransferase [Deinococcus irradiatisoli]|uniref:tRNA (Adenine-N(1))-methyltransferase n=1 Tax=Deinococcus irradiatisoli TaxID=2202254 RepID=A0A2Z3JED0_9DEIO|nr:tRNA (adenine(22)-N(1))-methyltransferase TrmK [Deinococcus irradiatisoli]AWN21821.1 tRNA (adenine-N(1))-methyltransferase [Deinococcus irradiatisoli]